MQQYLSQHKHKQEHTPNKDILNASSRVVCTLQHVWNLLKRSCLSFVELYELRDLQVFWQLSWCWSSDTELQNFDTTEAEWKGKKSAQS